MNKNNLLLSATLILSLTPLATSADDKKSSLLKTADILTKSSGPEQRSGGKPIRPITPKQSPDA